MGLLAFPTINGTAYSMVSVELRILNFTFVNVKDISYDRDRSRKMVEGTNPDPTAKTRGRNKYTASVELYLAEFNALIEELGPGYGEIVFPTFVTYSENGFDTITDEILGCTLDSTKAKVSGDDPLTRVIDLNPLKILYNGIDDVGLSLSTLGAAISF
jgi:hypothetical protein